MLIATDALWRDGRLSRDIAIEIRDGRVAAFRPLGTDTADLHVSLVAPMFTDLQVNGGGGVMVNSQPMPDGLRHIAAAHRRCGTERILPTVITDSFDITEAAAEAALATRGETGLAGLHIEGPHIAPERRGTHDPRHIRPLDQRTVALVERLRSADLPVMITLAPELADPDLLGRLVSCGAVVSAGHSRASALQTREALSRGVNCFTHLYNAMPPMTSREPGIVGTAINSTAHAGFIADGIHVSWDMLRIALRARPRSGLNFAVSDAMATVGGPDHFTLYGQTISLRDGALVNSEGALAGAHVDLVTSLGNLVRHVGLPLPAALDMVCDAPARVMNLPPARIDKGSLAIDLNFLTEDFTRVDITDMIA